MTFFDEAEAMQTMLVRRNMKREEISKIFGLSKSGISNKLRLLKLSPEVKEKIIQAGLTERHARLLLRLSEKDAQIELINEISARRLTVTETEAYLEIHLLKNANTNKNSLSKTEAKKDFLENIKKNINTLNAIGISAKLTVSDYEKKSYITIIIE